jgi:hypothetical protein
MKRKRTSAQETSTMSPPAPVAPRFHSTSGRPQRRLGMVWGWSFVICCCCSRSLCPLHPLHPHLPFDVGRYLSRPHHPSFVIGC